MLVRRSLGAPLLRALLLWLAAAAGTAGLAHLTLGSLHATVDGTAVDFEQALVTGCGAVGTIGLVVLLGAITGVLRDLVAGRPTLPSGAVRSLVLAACGLAFAAVTVPTAAHATPTHHGPSISGLPLPDRAVGDAVAPTGTAPGSSDDDVALVHPGDSLWSIAARHLGPGANDAAISSYWHRIREHNATVIGPDPDRILPGQQLRLPRPRPTEE